MPTNVMMGNEAVALAISDRLMSECVGASSHDATLALLMTLQRIWEQSGEKSVAPTFPEFLINMGAIMAGRTIA